MISLSSKPRVIVTRKFPDPVEARMQELFEVELNPTDTPFTPAQLVDALNRADILAPTITDKLDAGLIAEAGPQLKMIANFGVGVDHIDLDAAQKRNIVVSNTPGVLTEDTADIAMALMLDAARRVTEGDRVTRAGGFKGWHPVWMMGRSVHGKSLGIIGMGRIGEAVARRAAGFGMAIHYHNRSRASAAIEQTLNAVFWPDLDAMLGSVDFISVNCPRTPATYRLLDERRLSLIRPHAIIVNTARGDIIEEAALARMLADGRIAAAGLDVYEREPHIEAQLLGLDNVVLAPHLGSGTIETRTAMGEKVIVNIKAFLDGHRPPDRVFPVS
jgi:glyoxylate reductase